MSEFSSSIFTAPPSFRFLLRRHIQSPKPRPSNPTTTPAIAIPAKTPDDNPPDPSLGADVCEGVDVAEWLSVVVITVGVVLEVANVLIGVALDVEADEALASPTLGGPAVEPSRASTALRYVSSVVPVRPVMVNREE